ncbi:MAG: hypothetical protein HY815_02635 [Candidatus Riflebacteria bacterium]|nr:hypothetical protein [Candidatus Riflebacteria bacterium]
MLRSPILARWGLLTTVLLTAVVLVGTGVAGYLSTVDASDSVARARAVDLLFAARRELVQTRSPLAETTQDLFEEMAEQGLRFVALVARNGRLVASAGSPAAPLPQGLPAGVGRWPPPLHPVGDGSRYRVITRLAAQGVGRRRWRFEAVEQGPMERPVALVMEFEPLITARMIARARGTLAAGGIAAFLLVGAALVFWRMSVQREAIEAQLVRDRQLRVLGEMSAVLGHELKNPLTALKGHAQLLVERIQEGPGRQGAATIVREAVRLEQLAEHILAFARTGAVERETLDPLVVVRGAVDTVADERVRVVQHGDCPPWSVDRVRLGQALENLVRNAVQASPADQAVEVTVAVVGDRLRIDVRDHGEGIPPGEEARIFEPFHTNRTRGTGLGLTVASRVVQGHGGTIEASNPPGGGALFRVEIPREAEVA